ncbi:MAG: magnesium transporter [Vicingaceae bacterium]
MQFELTREFLDHLIDALEQQNESLVLELVGELHPADIAEIIAEISLNEVLELIKYLPNDVVANALIELEEETRRKILNAIPSSAIAQLLIGNLDSDDAADMIAELPDDKREEVIAQIEDIKQASDIVDLLNYDEDSAGGLMAKELVKVNINWNVLKCIKEIRKQAVDIENIYTVYVVDDHNKLLGTIPLKKIIISSDDKKVKDLYKPEVHSVNVHEKAEVVANLMEKYDLVVVPVVDDLNRLVGRITIDDIVDVIKEEADKDYQMASGISESVESSDTAWVLTRARLPWLLVGMVGGILSSKIISNYEDQIQLYPQMAFFIPLIAAMGGNVGVQSSAIVVQSLANKTVGLNSFWKKIFKEVIIGLINGIICSSIILAYNILVDQDINIAITVSIALISVIFFAGVFGTIVPLLLYKYKIDPALATGPFITTTNDIFGTFLYFFIGHLMYV